MPELEADEEAGAGTEVAVEVAEEEAGAGAVEGRAAAAREPGAVQRW